MGRKITALLAEHKLFFFLAILLVSYVGKINDGYVYQDAFRELGGDSAYVTADRSLRQEIALSGRKFRSILLNIAAPAELSGQYATTVRVYRDDEEIFTSTFSNDTLFEVDDPSGYATEFVFDHIVDVDDSSRYFLEITSDSPAQNTAYGFGLTCEGGVWSRTTYLLFTKAQRKLAVFLSVLTLSAAVYALMFLKRNVKWTAKPENIFLIMSIPLCILFLFLVPVFQVPDEGNHYVRAYGIVHGYFLTPSGGQIPIPENLFPFSQHSYTPYILFKNFSMQIDGSSAVLYDNTNMALYSPVSYVFQALGIFLGELLTKNTYVMVILGRLANAAGCTAIIYYAVKYIPYGKGILMFLALTPMALQERASLSVDAVTFAMALAVLAYCLYFRTERKQISGRQLGLLYVMLLMVASCKIVYFVAAGLVLLIPRECFGSRRKSVFHKTVSLAVVLLASLGWLFIAGRYLQYTRGGGETTEKIMYILRHPGRYLYIMDKKIWQDGAQFLYELLGSSLGSLNISVNGCLIIMLLAVLCGFVFWEKAWKKQPDYRCSLFLTMISAGTILLIFTSLYIQWTDINAYTYDIEGLQGRYFLPILPYLLCACISSLHPAQVTDRGRSSFMKLSYVLYFINLLVLVVIWEYSSFV